MPQTAANNKAVGKDANNKEELLMNRTDCTGSEITVPINYNYWLHATNTCNQCTQIEHVQRNKCCGTFIKTISENRYKIRYGRHILSKWNWPNEVHK